MATIDKEPDDNTSLAIVPVIISANGIDFSTFAFLDPGATVNVMREDIAEKLKCSGKMEKVSFGTFHGIDPEFDSMKVSVTIKSLDRSFEAELLKVSTVPKGYLKLPRPIEELKEVRERYAHLSDIKLASLGEPTILIGGGNQWLHLRMDERRPPDGINAPFGIHTPFGWTCVGEFTSPSEATTVCRSDKPLLPIQKLCYSIQESPTEELLLRQVEKLWETDSFPIVTPVKPLESAEDQLARNKLDASIKFDGTRFEVGLPWISDKVTLPDNYLPVLRRLYSVEHKFSRDSAFAEKYAAVIDDYISKGFAKPLKKSELTGTFGRNWYLPHHGVVNPQKPGKVRVVFDASAKHEGVALNEVLLKGPSLVNDIGTTLLLFREKTFSLSGDIQQMFLQVGVKKEDRSALRFLWRPPGNRNPPTIYEMQRQIFGSISSPFICSQVLRHVADLYREEFPEAAQRIYTNFYVDNLLDSFYTEEEAIQAVKDSTALLKKGGFHLNQWLSSSRQVLALVPECDRNQPRLNLDLDDLPTERTLGVLYDSESDHFIFDVKCNVEANTKRQILSAVSTLFDPLGFLSPIVLLAKRILQELWLVGVDWDQPIPNSIMQQWNQWTETLNCLKNFKVPRALTLSNEIKNIQLHAFCDASTLGFGSVVYLRVTYATDVVAVNFVSSKSRVAPLRPLTVPKLELQGAIVALRLVKFIQSSLRITINQVFYWSDSKTVLQWIASKTCRFQTFVANRVSEILEHSRPIEWRHVPGVENPADECSRGLFPAEIMENDRWLTGPAFLKQEDVDWPQPIKLPEPNEDDPEVSATKWVGVIYGPAPENRLRTLLERYSDYGLAMRVVAWMLRFIFNSRLKSAKERRGSFLSVKAIQQAGNQCIRSAQLECYPEEMAALEKKRSLKSSSPLLKLSPFIDKDGVMRVGGRLDNGPFSYDVKHPKILPHEHPITRLIIMREHDLLVHPSAERLLSSIRSRFWIIKGRVAIKRYLYKCLTCKRHRAMPCIPLMAPLPRHRLAPFNRPFTYVGLDFFGPCNITIYRRKEKRYVLLFTCLNTRAVHLEVTASLDLSSFLIAFASFSARRGRPSVVYSDNGTQIVAGNKEIQQGIERLKKQNLVGQMIKQEIEWHFSPPSAPHFGGVWESLVKSAKVALEAIVESRPLTEELLRGFVIQAESLLNGRPLTHVSVDPRDPEPLTPNHFLLLQGSPNSEDDVIGDEELYSRKHWEAMQVMSTHFWRRWLQEYLPTITDRRKWLFDKKNLAVDDVVLVVTPNSPRGHWPIGRVTRVVLSPDGVVRSVFVKTSAGEYHRPVAKLCLLETSTEE
jgi:hypothetical protein